MKRNKLCDAEKKVYRELDDEVVQRLEEEAFRGLDEEERVAFRECEGGI